MIDRYRASPYTCGWLRVDIQQRMGDGMERGGMEHGGAGRKDRHSRMGIASSVRAVLSIIAIVLFFVVSVSVASSEIGNDPQSFDPNSIDESATLATTFAFLGLGLIGSVLLTVIGFGIRVAGLIQRRRKRLFAILGTILNGLVVSASSRCLRWASPSTARSDVSHHELQSATTNGEGCSRVSPPGSSYLSTLASRCYLRPHGLCT